MEENKKKIDIFLEHNYNIITQQGMDLVKINYGSKGHKTRFYKLDPDSNTFNAREVASQQYPTHSYKIFKDVIKIVYGVKSPNLIKKLAAKKDKDIEAIKLLKQPRNILSIITKKRSLDFYCSYEKLKNEQINNLFYGLKKYTDDKNVGYKIISTNQFLLQKVKFKIVMKLKDRIENGEILDENQRYSQIIRRLSSAKRIQNISFFKLILLYNILMK